MSDNVVVHPFEINNLPFPGSWHSVSKSSDKAWRSGERLGSRRDLREVVRSRRVEA